MLALAAVAIPLPGAAVQSIANLPAIAARMDCTLQAFQTLDLNGVADDNGQVAFTTVSLVNVSATNPAAYCSVRGVIGPGASSIVMKLPMTAWTQRYVQNGCGGECGNDNLGNPTQSSGCAPVIAGELVTATTNMGHVGAEGATWIVDKPWAGIDFAYRGVHVASQVAKAVIRNFYGRPAAYSYFDGCSDGGREALMSAQRYPDDFDGIAAGAPANNMDVQNTYHHANRVLTNQVAPGYMPLPARNTYLLLRGDLPYVHAKVVAACDGLDGVFDGIIDDPRNCKFDTNTLVCGRNGNEPGCLTQAQADAVFRIHDGAKTDHGVRLEPEIAVEWGSELDWTLYMPAAQGGAAMAENFVNGWLYKTFI
ncbi:MAG: tannase/feruloyl esterase family alpha/beta hydrolase, partial [Burkholderiales bacterium]